MKKFVTAAAVLSVAGVASAAGIKDYSNVTADAFVNSAFNPRVGFTMTGFEASEGYVLGNIDLQNGWNTFTSQDATGEGAHVVDLGGNKGRVLSLFENTGAGAGSFAGGFSPAFKNPLDLNGFKIDTKIDDQGGADYDVIVQSPGEGSVVFRVKFSYTGEILVLDDTGLGAAFASTGFNWAQNQWNQLSVSENGDGTLSYFYGGNNIYNSVGQAFADSWTEAVILHDNFQSFSGSANPAGYFDNMMVVPTPGAAALFGVAGLAAIRRRR